MRKRNASRFARHLIGTYAIQEGLRPRTADVVFREAREVENPDAPVHGGDFIAYHVEYIVARIAIFFAAAVRGEPFRALPAEGFGMHAALRLKFRVQRADLAWASRHFFLAGPARRECQPVILEHLVAHVARIGKRAKSPRIELGHVDLGIA